MAIGAELFWVGTDDKGMLLVCVCVCVYIIVYQCVSYFLIDLYLVVLSKYVFCICFSTWHSYLGILPHQTAAPHCME